MNEPSVDAQLDVPEKFPKPRGVVVRPKMWFRGIVIVAGLLALVVLRRVLVAEGLEGVSRVARSLAAWKYEVDEPPLEDRPGAGVASVDLVPEEPGVEEVGEVSFGSKDSAAPPLVTFVVSEETVTNWVRRGAIPAAAPLPARGRLPAGVGIARLGTFVPGLTEEDRLVRVEGRVVGSAEDVVTQVASALRAGRRRIHATFARLERGVVVERVARIPLPTESPSPPP